MAETKEAAPTIEHINVNYVGTVPYPHIDHMGRCYDFIKMDPFDLSLRVKDGGGGMTERVIDIPSELVKQQCSDQSVLIPLGTTLASESRGMRTSRTETWFDATELSSSLEKTVSYGLSIPGLVSFSASSTYSEFNKTTSTNETMETFVQGIFEDCHISFNDDVHNHLPLNEKFKTAVAALKSEGDCTKFMETFGTHYAHEVTFGGRMYQRIKFTTTSYLSIKESGKNFSSTVEGTFKKASASVGGGSSSSSGETFESKSGITVEDIQWVGGTPDTNFDDWVKTVRAKPKPVRMDLRPLHELFTKDFFPKDDKIAAKKKWLEAAITAYIKVNAYIRPDPQSLGNKKYHILNRWRADVGERRVDKHVGFHGDNIKLYDKDNTEDLTPWLLVPVPNKTDEFYIQNKWKESENEKRVDMYIGISDKRTHVLGNVYKMDMNICLTDKRGGESLTPWRFIPVPGRPDEYYIRNRWHAEQGASCTDYHMAFTGDDVELYDKDNRYDLAPWKLVPVPG